MFRWIAPKCPVDPETKGWIERRMAWLAEQFGWERMLTVPALTPTRDFFPHRFDCTEHGARRLFEDVCTYAGIEPSQVHLYFFDEGRQTDTATGMLMNRDGAAGLYHDAEGNACIGLEISRLHDPVSMIATFAHELGHVHLLSSGRIDSSVPDHEPLTDLLTVFLGFGVFSANSVIREEYWSLGQWSGWNMARQGYLSFPMYAYALALFAWNRGEDNPAWADYLRPDVRAPFRKAMRYLCETHDSRFNSTSWSALLHEPLSSPDKNQTLAENGTNFGDGADAEALFECDSFTAGIEAFSAGDFGEAVRFFSQALQEDPDDAEAYLHRAKANYYNEAYGEAICDAAESLKRESGNVEAYRIRANSYFAMKRYDLAIQDYSTVLDDLPKDADALFCRGQAYSASHDYQRALADLKLTIRYEPSWAEAYLVRSEVHDRLGKTELADADRVEAFRRNPELRDQ
jgi:tetratricopeptide (TPR) repeat protein